MCDSYYQNNKKTILAKAKEKYKQLTPEQKENLKIYNKNYYKKNKERRLEQQKKYALTDAGIAVRKKANSKWYKKNKDYLREQDKKYQFKRKLAILQGNNL
jgi:lysozyme family protein